MVHSIIQLFGFCFKKKIKYIILAIVVTTVSVGCQSAV